MSIQLDARTFHRRARQLLSYWKVAADSFEQVDSIVVVTGNADEEIPYQKSTALQTWLLGYEFPSTLLVVTADTFHFITSASKGNLLEGLKVGSSQVPIEIHKRSKDDAHNRQLFENVIELIGKSNEGKRIGVFAKDKVGGKFVDEWKNILKESSHTFEEIDISPAIAATLAVKEEEEIKTTKLACRLSSLIMKNFFIDEMSSVIDEEKQITHDKLSELTENSIWDENIVKRLRFPADVSLDLADWCYSPIVQSGGSYDLRSSAISNNDNLHAGTIVCSLGIRYKSYCSNIGRTFLIDPNKTQEKNYEFLLDLQRRVMDSIKDGVKLKDVYLKAVSYIKSKRPELEKHFVKNCGFVTGIEFRESAFIINGKNNRTLKSGMAVIVVLGFQDIENPKASDSKSKLYSLLLIDTVRVTNSSPTILTECSASLNDVSYFFKDDAEEEEAEEVVKKERAAEPAPQQPKNSAILKSKFRSQEQTEESAEQKRKDHQKELAGQIQAEGLARFAEGKEENADDKKAVFKKYESYKRETLLPKEVKELRIVVDHKNESIILPIYGLAVPFHISTLKNASKNDEGDYVYLRLNFLTPGQGVGKKEDMPFDDPNANFVRALTYRSSDTYRMTEIYKNILDLKKNLAKREAEKKEMADIIEQDKLIEVKGKRPFRLPDVFARPVLDGKRIPGELEIHVNGLRYISPLKNEQKIDLLFSNIKHLFFQPCDHELVVILHVHLKNPIMIGKKKTKDVQFYREASDAQFDETGNRRRRYNYGDEDELEAEQEERRRRALLNKEFRSFSEKIAELSESRVEVDVPFRELGFQGVPYRTNVLLQPTTEALIHLSDPPFLVITLADIELAHLERVQFGLKNFDLVFVFKDYSRQPFHINTIPMTQLDNVKEWLDSVDVPFTEGPLNLNWNTIMKTINEDPAAFFQDGGWSFLRNDSDAENSDATEEMESEFEMESDDFAESSTEESSMDSDDYSESDSGSGSEEEESGEDWDELEEKARKCKC
ncbi:SPT16-domain-containing protein [Basidiobolus meristosporus CBS 931.73]|uniref:FACT complex subunit n=1 Tax=Basidiobolus meristosporus CBS 931.73 TaxID=1314790 RepID=A0A1Y1YMM7_9FUNG|nr:SPT16-domain-containing protein [Basidiobolus meristosporus CBS 931.73]|eukprot:ORX99261.1 SPT16-domain-containing protein [Basidiobolus meristosporus CBS 931.73]